MPVRVVIVGGGQAGFQVAASLRGKGFDVSLQIEPGAPHTITPAGLAFASRFIAAVSATV